ncbi:UTP--glucose-1-phosphate uridylyltransferase [Acetitomaculum ruminis DSM 5522]|uniref:UTP--glucose-1-phosphate uridylyltransferase n=1 Tax=Acetitomaculum ruminis DSM 5522 TaxID=1120918 RepID=A0A1I0W513_9FIRM|nr:UTP--glucose-1-phosphate uridylyltransferase GalU [Acetitomaculum ruminis]SFA83865.1 UTP--glucose-1-phosphate uridylyltransferase [Acetitomaculum ruminis DSM 5522]
MKVRKAIIPAAGLGTRFLPVTKAQAKEMLPIVDKPTIQYIVEEAVEAGIQDIIIVTGRSKRSIEDHFDRSIELEMELERHHKDGMLEIVREIPEMANIHYIRQKEPRGLGHAILTASHFIGDEPFAVMLGDDIVISHTPCLKQMLNIYENTHGNVLGVQTVAHKDVNKYGIIEGEKKGDRLYKVTDMVEKPDVDKAPSDVAVLGRYIINPSIFGYLSTQEEGTGGEIQLTDALKRMVYDGVDTYAYDFKGHRYDVGSKIGFLQANIECALRDEKLKDELKEYLKELNENMDEMIRYE